MSQEYEGGEKPYQGDGPNRAPEDYVPRDSFVARIVQDPKEPPELLLLSGYMGASSEEGCVRLYLDEELGRYVEIPADAIRHTQELPPEQSPLGGSLVWIDRKAEVVHGKAGGERSKASFLEGQIAQDYMGSAAAGGAAGEVAADTRLLGCGGGGILPTDMGPGCGASHFQICVPRTESPGCRTLTGIFCTRFGPGCRRTIFEPACTLFGPNCHTAVFQHCISVHYPCVTQNRTICAESGFVGCNPPPDWTVFEQGPFDQQAINLQRAGGGGFGDPFIGVFQTGFNCPSVFDNCATRESFCPPPQSRFIICRTQQFVCVTQSAACNVQ